MTIWKFPISITDVQEINMPLGARILCVQLQHDIPTLWAVVDADSDHKEKRKIIIRGTGHEFVADQRERYIGTIQTHTGRFVWHVFFVIE